MGCSTCLWARRANVCEREEEIYSTITRFDVSSDAAPQIVARGVRNSVGFDWHPETETLWLTDNGRDRLGDDVPPDELNRLPEARCSLRLPVLSRRRPPRPRVWPGAIL